MDIRAGIIISSTDHVYFVYIGLFCVIICHCDKWLLQQLLNSLGVDLIVTN